MTTIFHHNEKSTQSMHSHNLITKKDELFTPKFGGIGWETAFSL